MPPEPLATIFAGIFGLVVGSFLNVVIWRLPRGQSVVRPRSRCPGCGRSLRWFENVPVLSWLFLLGRCAGCRMRIPARYPLVELVTGALFLGSWLVWRDHPFTAAFVAAHLAALLAITFIDAEHKIIPDAISKPALVLALVAAPWTALPDRPKVLVDAAGPMVNAWLVALAGAALGAGVLLAIRWIASALKKREAMGLGDVKLLAWIGALVGPTYVLLALVVGCLAGSVIGLGIVVAGSLRALPCRLRLSDGDAVHETDRVRIADGALLVEGVPGWSAGSSVTVRLVLPAVRVLEDEDVTIEKQGRLASVEAQGSGVRWRVQLDDLSDAEDEHLFLFRHSNRYVPFGPFLALGGAVTLLAPAWIWWAYVDAWPSLIRRG